MQGGGKPAGTAAWPRDGTGPVPTPSLQRLWDRGLLLTARDLMLSPLWDPFGPSQLSSPPPPHFSFFFPLLNLLLSFSGPRGRPLPVPWGRDVSSPPQHYSPTATLLIWVPLPPPPPNTFLFLFCFLTKLFILSFCNATVLECPRAAMGPPGDYTCPFGERRVPLWFLGRAVGALWGGRDGDPPEITLKLLLLPLPHLPQIK